MVLKIKCNDFITPLKSAVDLLKLGCQKGVEFELDNENLCLNDNSNVIDYGSYDKNQLSSNICFMSDDEDDSSDDGEYMTEMERLYRKMKRIKNSDITPEQDGGVLKQMKKPGFGKTVPEKALVQIHYNAYSEIGQPPYDSTRMRGEPMKLRLGQGASILGLELAILSMAKHEISRFLIHYSYGYGEMGCPPRIPPKATLIIDLEVMSFTEQDGVDDYYDLTPEERRAKLKYVDIEKVVNVETAEGKQYFDSKNYQKASYKYSRAQNILEEYHLKNDEEEKLWTKQLLKVYTNSAICHHNLKQFGRTIHFCNEILKKDKNNVKAHYFKGKALHGIGNFLEAKNSLKLARNLDPSNTAISSALQSLAKSMKEQELFEKNMCQKMFSKPIYNAKSDTDVFSGTEKKEETPKDEGDQQTCSEDFRNLVEEQLQKFQKESDMTEMPFPCIQMNNLEIACILETADKLGLGIRKRGTGSQLRYEVHKKCIQPDEAK
ncbi:inactive peptidyl-prolyl cis-trans isomerase FKBP6-like isoform X1 [Biomphalaria glabrata]|uniref:peptidylprolyl isomerase n=1 Tax=Biomphalaria glabrata TaxID=6526 RepID=A0A9U8E8G1_BIOGL|nr:inactive peptidyl-prolyl cis-trans isomerase FKBP6-like isoform X1 [Biomphalaria glabrata]KAI8782892.1 inactive peptidyl-prolyl cis-trans isomerase FKBP6 isoform X1 [Biomphalaria glabrata]